MLFHQNVDAARAHKVGVHDVSEAALGDATRKAEPALEALRGARENSGRAAR